MSEPSQKRRPRWFLAQGLVFSGVPFVLAGWLLLVADQPLGIKIFAAAVVVLAGLWNLDRAMPRGRR